MDGKILAGVAGAGVFGGYHAQKYAGLDGVRLAAVYDVDPARSAALARLHGAEPFADYAAFLGAVDVLTVAAPASAHFELARQALVAGKSVLVEKPLALDLAHADELIALAARRGLVLQVGHQERFVAEALGLFARPRPQRVWCARRNPPSGRGGDVSVVFDLMIHDLDLIRRLDFGALAAVSASGGRDEATAELLFDSGATAMLTASRIAGAPDRRMRLLYEDGLIEIDFARRSLSGAPALAGGFDQDSPALADPLGYGVERFVQAAARGGPPEIPGEAGRAALEWATMIEAALVKSAPGALRKATP
ncbi:Gfo/Idh/MocA family protein [Amphiplicatus metriothermophilus]|uniref:Predicted dehydrogenase n=1 Tax=Amphiplicatus metriothermophilus TaxID=1519374 RepID=A0A239PKF2_9PROT|nr:Gfo/Idh/MocA family oxidoreductase [Amphiplicatus metriothermophilus]MBB5517873.1 putative dehydrogenase [Amphiplicatus metriothermophilus]SNT67793.1 Predicted dehydrogenase [Amphiplicatus metriothermophilus]